MDALATIALSFVLSFIFGMERQLSKKPVGFAPYVLVTVLSTTLALLAVQFFPAYAGVMLSGIITSIGFLGAGALIKYRERVFGFTSAATIWAMAAFGVLIGAYPDLLVIGATYALIWLTVIIDHLAELKGLGRHMHTVVIEVKGMGSHADIKEIMKKYRESHEETVEMNFDRGVVEYRFTVPMSADIDKLAMELSKLKNIRKIVVE